MLDTLFTAGSVYHFLFPSEKLLLSCSKPSGVSGHKEKEQLGQRSDVLPFPSLALLRLLGLSPFPTHALSLCTNPQSHSGHAHGTGSCPPHRSDCSRVPVVRKALYRLKTQTPSTGHGGAEPLFPSVKHPGLVGPCVSLGRAGRSTALLCYLRGPLHWRRWEQYEEQRESPTLKDRPIGTSLQMRPPPQTYHVFQNCTVLGLALSPAPFPPRALALGHSSPTPPEPLWSTQGPNLPCCPDCAPRTCLPPSPRHSGGPPSLGGVDSGLSLLEGRAAWTQLHPVPWWKSL